ncbi:TBC1 domain family member 14 [Leucoagaricus sp. SymC.cos]|nr:TBC1 domain family member 14 [Leucoagaricus sp. SymC.cos]
MSTQNVPLQVPIHHVSALDDDDAFAITDESPAHIFSRDAIREEIAHNLNTAWTNPQDGTYDEPDNSVSTLDINGDVHQSPVEPEPSSADPSILSADFSQISLSNDPHDRGVDRSAVEFGDHGQSDAPYPSIVIDASEASEHGVILTLNHSVPTPPSPPFEPSPAPSTRSLPPETTARSPQVAPQNEPASASSPAIPPLTITANTHQSSLSSETGQQNAQALAQKQSGHRPSRSTGPSMFEKVRSKTRPTFLPPKPKAEDEKHLADWENMMKFSRLAAEKRRKILHERRMAREQQIEISILTWEKEIMPDWRVVLKNPQLRRLWWKGIPTKLRASLWEKAVGNPLALSKDHFRSCLSRAKRALSANLFPQATLDLIEQDIRSTLPSVHLFHPETGPMYSDLKDMLYAWVVARSDEGLGYTFGAAKLAGMMLITMPIQQAFNVMRNLLERHCMRSFYGGERSKDDVEAYYRIFDTLLADGMPKIYFNFKQHQISPAAYLSDWLVTLFLDHLPFEAISLGILGVLEPRLFFPDRTELFELLRGENKAAIEVAKREGQTLNGGKYEIYGVDEETLWERIDAMEDWWKESTWTRLIQRELPDL